MSWPQNEIIRPTRKAKISKVRLILDSGEYIKGHVYMCSNCRTLYEKLDDAECCAVKPDCTEWSCQECGNPARPHQRFCESCRSAYQKEYELKKLEQTKKVIDVKDYPIDQGIFYDDEYYSSIETFLEHCEENGVEVPPRVWATTASKFQLDANDILDAAIAEWSDGCAVGWSIYGEKELKEAVRIFNDKQSAVMYLESDTVVELPKYFIERKL